VRVHGHLRRCSLSGANSPDGSYAITIGSAVLAVIPASAPVIWVLSTSAVLPASRSASTSPMQTTGMTPVFQRRMQLLVDDLVGFSKVLAPLEWPINVCVPPTASNWPTEVSPVYAPSSAK